MKTASTLKEHCEALQERILDLEQRLHEVADDRKRIREELKQANHYIGQLEGDIPYGN